VNIEEMLAAMEADEKQDALEEQTVASISDYARARGFRPQLIHYHIRAGHIMKVRCACGRWVINIAEADAVMAPGRTETVQAEESVSGGDLDTSEPEC
jgi:hypothetical protein